MSFEQRKNERYADIGRAEAPELCIFPGVLEDISLNGCKIRFPALVDIDMDSDVELKISTTRKSQHGQITLIGHPQWIKHESDLTTIGFKFLHSPGTSLLSTYVDKLEQESIDSEFEEDLFSICFAI